MKYGILITARLKSKRLKKKIIRKINRHNLITFLIKRLKQEFYNKNIVLITSKSNQDKKLVDISIEEKINYFRGEPKDVLKRIYDASKKFKFNNVISCTADNPFVDTKKAKKMMVHHMKKKNDLTIMKGLPIGLFSYALNINAVKKVLNTKASKDTETWGGYFTENKKLKVGFYKINLKIKNIDNIRLTVDVKQDLMLIKKILKISKNEYPTTYEILSIIRKHPSLLKINSNVKQKKVIKPKFK